MKDLIERLLSKSTDCHASEMPLYIEAADAINKLYSQLPEGMKHCTILFKECPVGHGWLTATNWVDHGCPTCTIRKWEKMHNDVLKIAIDFALEDLK
jgi:hypothetical protein